METDIRGIGWIDLESDNKQMKKALQDIANIIYKHSFDGFPTEVEIKIFDICQKFTKKPDEMEIS